MKRLNHVRGYVLLLLIALLIAAGSTLSASAANISVGGGSDCDANAIVNCGVHTTGAVKDAYQSSSYVRKVYRDFGISSAEISNLSSTNVVGRVTKSGDVYITGSSKPVATNAVTGGRQNIAGSTKVTTEGITYYRRTPSVSFQSSSLPAFVSMVNGKFQFAIIASCGNAVSAKAVVPPQPKPTPPTPTPPVTPPSPPVAPPTPPVAPPTTPILPSTGASGMLGIFIVSTTLGILGYRYALLRKIST